MKHSPWQRPSAIALAVIIGLGGMNAGFAEDTNWNPKSWFSGSATAEDSAAEASRLAEQAERAADQAEKAATQARERAEQTAAEAEKAAKQTRERAERARKAAEEARASQAKAAESYAAKQDTKPVVEAGASTSPAFIPNKTGTETTPNFTNAEYQQAKTKGGGWNPMNLFKFGNEEAAVTETPQAPATKPVVLSPAPQSVVADQKAAEAVQAQAAVEEPAEQVKTEPVKTEAKAVQKAPEPAKAQAATETQATEEKNGWGLVNLFKRSEESETAKTETHQKPAEENPEAAMVEPSVKTKAALIETEKGNIAIEFFSEEAPQTVANFVKLVGDGFYNKYNMKFHRVIPGFVVQTGDPTGTGAGGSQQRIPLEVKNKLSHDAKGVVAMARGPAPDSASSQFYITLAPQTSLDAKYAIFGRVISGLEVLDKIEKDDMLYGIRLVELSSVKRDQEPEKKNLFSKMF